MLNYHCDHRKFVSINRALLGIPLQVTTIAIQYMFIFSCFLIKLAKLEPKIKEFLRKHNDPENYMSLGYLAKILKPKDIKLLSKEAFE